MHRVNATWVAVAFVCALRATALADEPAPNAAELYVRARDAYQSRRFDVALRLLREAHRLEPKPLYAYNIATVLESRGEYRQAYEGMLRVLAHPGLGAELERLAQARAERLAPLVEVATLVLAPAAAGTGAQLDASHIENAETQTGSERRLEPGTHLLCALRPEAAEADCTRLALEAGRRVSVAAGERETESRGSLRWEPSPGVTELILDGWELHLDARVDQHLTLDAGRWRLAARDDAGAVREIELALAPDEAVRVSVAPAPDPTSPAAYAAAWTGVGVGAGGITAGAVLLAAAASDRSRVESEPRNMAGVRTGLTEREAHRLWERSESRTRWGAAAVAAGGVLAAAGGTWLLWRSIESGSAQPILQVEPLPAGAALTVRY